MYADLIVGEKKSKILLFNEGDRVFMRVGDKVFYRLEGDKFIC